MDWTNKNVDPKKVVNLGDEVEVMVLEIDEDRRRISLGMKQCKPNPWEDFAQQHKKGDKVGGAIKSITDFGVFIGLPGGIDGLVHLSDLSWSEPGEEAVRRYKKGDEIEAMVLAIDTERERISLGVKQMSRRSVHQLRRRPRKRRDGGRHGEVGRCEGRRDRSWQATSRASCAHPKSRRDRVEDARNHLKEGDAVNAMIINIDRKNRNINLSVKAKDSVETAATMERMQSEAANGNDELGSTAQSEA